ncbi:MAG: acyl carrier protein [Clostridiales bacterium]|nr:acyl carrier protein [Clostridiales bacterium]
MTRDEYAVRIKEIVAEQLNYDIEKLTDDTLFVEDLNADSLEIVELVMALENEFDAEISEDAIEKIKSIGDLADALANM